MLNLYLTKGIFGPVIEKVGSYADNQTAMNAIYSWKKSEKNQSKYKIEQYDRVIVRNGTAEIERAIDFGDYYTFFLITKEHQ